MTPDASVRTIGETDRRGRGRVLEVLVRAFDDDPVSCWLFPAAPSRGFRQRAFFSALLARDGVATYLIGAEGSDDGASVWISLDAGRQPFDDPDDVGDDSPDPASAIFGDDYERILALGRLLPGRHPIGECHLYLASLGVVPGRRNARLGTELLLSGLERADADGVVTYLEASSERSRALYLRHGFEDRGEPIDLPDGPRVWPMARPSRELTFRADRS
jgi:ribosomal protein S18 acetylase RimI-like enzyme